jgi:catechol 2,3-dioxygenase-like lactoylglutathione lyase family enzyme
MDPMAHVQRFDHIGITVADLDLVTAFFVGLGLEVEGTGSVEGEFVETVCGIPGAHCEIAMLRPPDGGSPLELASFVTPDHVPGSPTAMATNWVCATCPPRLLTTSPGSERKAVRGSRRFP